MPHSALHGLQVSAGRFNAFSLRRAAYHRAAAMDPGPSPRPPQRITGVAGLLRALRELGLMGHAATNDRRLVRFTADDGQSIPVRVIGSGPPVVLVHGLGGSANGWVRILRPLARAFSAVHAVDLPGSGFSPGTR